MSDLYNWLSSHLIGRIAGPLNFRLLLQPTIAVIFAIRDGSRDAREGQPLYFWGIIREPERRKELILEGCKSIAKLFIFAALMDLIYQYLVFNWLYLTAALVVAFKLAFVPYLLVRGATNRVMRRRRRS